MKNMLIILMLLVFSVAISGCGDISGPCAHGVCTEEHSKATGPSEEKPEE